MLQEIIEPAWLDAFEAVLGRCALKKGDTVAILAETQSRPVLPLLARLAAQRLGAQVFTLTLPSVVGRAGPPARSTGASDAIQQIKPVVHALAASTLVVDCTVEGLMHAPELPAILKGGSRVIYISNEHPEALVRLMRASVASSGIRRTSASGCS
nr:peptidase M29 [Burkholderiaceae bacterium]